MAIDALAAGDDRPARAVTVDRAETFERFYRAEYASVVRVAYALTGRRDLAEEHAQEAFLAAHRRWRRVGAYDRPDAWVRRVVVNRCASDARRRATEIRLVARLGRERVEEPRLSERTDAVWVALRSLPRRQAQVLALAFVEDRSVDDIARILGRGEATVRTHLRRGRLALASRLSTDEGTT